MQELLEQAIRVLGRATLFVVTLGRYRGRPGMLLGEGAAGIALLVAIGYVIYVWAA